MVQMRRFEVEVWMDRLEVVPNVLNVAETCCDSVSIQDLERLSKGPSFDAGALVGRRLTYGAIPGSETTRRRIAALYDEGGESGELLAQQVVLTPGAIMANYLVFYSLVGPGDHVVCVYPTYQQLYDVPKSMGAEVSLWRLREDRGWLPDLEELEELVKPNTKMIVVNNPNNPFGSVMTRTQLQAVVDFAQARDIIVLCDEVYRPLFHSLPEDQEAPPSILSLGYAKTISTSSMSKAFSLAGIRVGWIATRDEGLLAAVADARHYSTISVSQLDDAVAAYALSDAVRPGLLRRNMELARANLALLEAFVAEHQGICHWTRPAAGTTAMVRFARTTPAAAAAALDGSGKDGEPVKDDDFCLALVDDAGVLVMPGRVCFGHGDDFAGYMRLGYVCATETLREALARLGPYIRKKLR